MYSVSQESEKDEWEVETLYDLSFAPGRETLSSYRLREGVDAIKELCLLMRDEYGAVAGVIRYWPVIIGKMQSSAILLGPIAVHPTHQGEGLGAGLIRHSLKKAKKMGWQRVILIGDKPYYKNFGFKKAVKLTFPAPSNPERLLCLELENGAFDNVSGLVKSIRTI